MFRPGCRKLSTHSPPASRRTGLPLPVGWSPPDNPLAARVVVNRHWAAFFGTGIVRTVGNFGAQGEAPSHPALLDWLATEFVANGWSIKKLHRIIVTSATYRQRAEVTPARLRRDPDNRLLSRAPRFRLEAEIIRDGALRAAGRLSDKMYGAPVRPPQPKGVTEVAYGKPKWTASKGEDRFRRSIYTFAKRTAPFALYNTFDAPSGEACVARREGSNTPLQALTLLNDPMMLEIAQEFGRRMVAEAGELELAGAMRLAFRRVLTRGPSDDELESLTTMFGTWRDRFDGDHTAAREVGGERGDDPVSRATWTAVGRVLLSLDEAITRN